MTTTDSPAATRRTGLIPRFSPPPTRNPDSPLSPEQTPAGVSHPEMPEGTLYREGAGEPRGVPSLPPDPSDTRTRTSDSTGEQQLASAADIAKLVAGVLGIIGAGVAWAVRLRYQQRAALRRPSDDQVDDVARPLSRILRRHVPITKLGPDLFDVLQVGVGVMGYLEDGPLLEYLYADPGIGDIPQPGQEA